MHLERQGRGRDAGSPAPPAQVLACGTTAPGSCLGCDAQTPKGAYRTQSSAYDRVSRPCVRPLVCSPAFPLASSLFPTPPPVLAHQNYCSGVSPILWGCPTPRTRASRSYPCGAVGTWWCSPGQMQSLPDAAHSVSVHVRDLRPRQVCPSRTIAGGSVAFRVLGARRHQAWPIADLNTLLAPSPVNASYLPLPRGTHDSGPAWLTRPSLSETFTLQHSRLIPVLTLTVEFSGWRL
jgi:hypothetical protein